MKDHQSNNHNILENSAKLNAPPLEMASAAALPSVTVAMTATLVDFSPDALIVVNQEGKIVQLNEQASTLFGYSQEELLDQPLEVLLPERFHTTHMTHRALYVTSPVPRPMGTRPELVGRRKDNSEFPVDIYLRPILIDQTLHVVSAIRDVTNQRLVQQELAQQAEHIRVQSALIQNSHDAILVRDPISRMISWNHGAEELYGWTELEAIGRIAHILLKTRFPVSSAVIDIQLEREGHWEGELVHTRRDGKIVVVESRQVLMRDESGMPTAILEINRDITERRRLEQSQASAYAATLAQRTFLQQIMDVLPSSIYVVHGREARLVLTNRASASIWGAVWQPEQSMSEFLALHSICIVDSQGRPFPTEAWATIRALQGETVLQHQEVIRQPTGSSLPIIVNAVPLASPYWQSLLGQEGQDSLQPSQEHEPLALVIHQDVRTLKEAEYIKDEFIGIAAHELRAPLAVLKGAVGTLVRQTACGHGPQLAEWQYEVLQELEQATDRLSTLTEDLLDVTRLQAGQLFLQRTPVNLVSLIQRLVERLQQTTTRHHLRVLTAQPILEAYVDSQRIEQVLNNIVINAIKYSPRGGPVEVTLGIVSAGQLAEIRVQDHGMGIPQRQQGLIFGRFMRADNAQAAGISGTGLGLYLCRALVEQHEGQLWFESTEGEGTTFFLTLPLVIPL